MSNIETSKAFIEAKKAWLRVLLADWHASSFNEHTEAYLDSIDIFNTKDDDIATGLVEFARIQKRKIKNIDNLPVSVLKDIEDFLIDNRKAQASAGARIMMRTMSDNELMDAYLCWNGIQGYTHQIIRALDGIRAMSQS